MTAMTDAAAPPHRVRLGVAYWRLWWANAVSNVGDGAFTAALPLLAVTITRDPRLISITSVASFLPWLLVSLPVGVLVDRYDRATLMWRSQVVQGAVVTALAVLVAVRRVDIAVLAVAGFCLSSAQVVFSNAAQSVLPRLVPAGLLPKANGNQYVVQTIGQSFAGPPLGSLLFGVGAALPFGVDAGSFAVSAALLTGLPKQGATPTAAGSDQGMITQISAGLRWLLSHRLLRIVGLLLSVNNFFNQVGMATLVLLATQTLHVGTRGYGLLLAASAVGGIVGALVNPALTQRAGQLPSLIAASAANAVIFLGIGLAPNAYLAAVLLAGNGFVVTMWNVVTVTMRQQIVPESLLGRVNSAYRMLGWGMLPLGALASGFVAGAGLRTPFTVAGVLRGVVLLAAVPALLAAARPKKETG
jgi:MFS family permease